MRSPAIRWLPDRPLDVPAPWPDRPWIFGVMVASANGVFTWQRAGPDDDPVLAILGGDDRPERRADRRLMRELRTFGDVGIGAQTVRDQPALVLTPQEPHDEPAPELYRRRAERGLPHHPRNIIYSLFGRLPREHPIFHVPGLQPIVVTTPPGRAELARRGLRVPLVVQPEMDGDGLTRAHQELFAVHGVRHLDCEGGPTVLAALQRARLLDEVFLTVTDVVIDTRRHRGVLTSPDFAASGARLIAEGRVAPDSRYTFQRWRFADRAR
jgi:riboflavin biosynthesis pyrimidine reductase